MFKRSKKDNFVLVRVCVGCILPHNAKLIGSGTYIIFGEKGKINEQYYDYEIEESDLDYFLEINYSILVKNQLLEVEEKQNNMEDKNPNKPTTIRGWSKKE
jgi:hypothetical protein